MFYLSRWTFGRGFISKRNLCWINPVLLLQFCFCVALLHIWRQRSMWKRRTSTSASMSFSSFFRERVNACPNNCSGRGECRLGNSTASVYCECEANWKGDACDVPYCQDSCGYPDRGHCQGQACVCEAGWQGERTVQQPHFDLGFRNTKLSSKWSWASLKLDLPLLNRQKWGGYWAKKPHIQITERPHCFRRNHWPDFSKLELKI